MQNMGIIHRDQYAQIWSSERVNPFVIDKAVERYEHLPIKLVYEVATDDGRMGPTKTISIPYSPEEVEVHDLELLLAKRGFPISTNLEANLRFGGKTLIRGGKSAIIATTAIPVAIIGTIGGIMWWYIQ